MFRKVISRSQIVKCNNTDVGFTAAEKERLQKEVEEIESQMYTIVINRDIFQLPIKGIDNVDTVKGINGFAKSID